MKRSVPHTYNLRTVFELRKTKGLAKRRTVGRLFFHEEQPGLADASGAIWPLRFSSRLTLPESGTVLLCTIESIAAGDNTKTPSKYRDDGFRLEISDLLDTTLCRDAWPNACLNAPIPDANSMPSLNGTNATRYIKTSSLQRAKRIAIRNLGIERTVDFFRNRGFTQMETPSLVPSGGVENYLSAFQTNYLDVRGKSWPLSLPTSPEFALKKLLAEGHGKIFQLARSFRNAGELARWHEPEFIMLEWYRVGATLDHMMDDTRNLVLKLEEQLSIENLLPRQWKSFRVNDLFIDLCDINLETVQSETEFRTRGARISRSIVESDDWDSTFCKLFMEKIEPVLQQEGACFVSEYPRQMGALARVSTRSPLFVDRFEAYLNGVEICNGYYELTDTEELESRFSRIGEKRPEEVRRDEIFERTMRYGLPPCSGNALGLDRVIAILSGHTSISELMAIPFLSQFSRGTVAPE